MYKFSKFNYRPNSPMCRLFMRIEHRVNKTNIKILLIN